jgi:hypothetical protein
VDVDNKAWILRMFIIITHHIFDFQNQEEGDGQNMQHTFEDEESLENVSRQT